MRRGATAKVKGFAHAGSIAWLVMLSALRVSGHTRPWAPAALAFTPFVVPAGTALALVAGVRRRPARALLATAPAALAAVVVAPRTRPRPQPAARGARLTVMSANVYKGRADAEVLVALVRERRPDVLAVQEQNPRFIGELERAGLFDLLPFRVVGDGGRMADGSLFSRHPLTAIAPELPSEYLAAAVTLPGGPSIPVICAHPLPPSSPRYEAPWIRSLKRLPSPSGWMTGGVVVGDFNATLDHPQFRAVLATGWRDAGRETGDGLRPTWGGHGILRLTIDHVLVPPGAAAERYRVDRLAGSDHRVITASIVLPA